MKKKIVVFLLLLLICAAATNVFADNDKIKHFGISSIFGAAGESILHYGTKLKAAGRILLGTTLGSLPGLVKELIDSTEAGNNFSGSDMAYNIAGAFIGALVANFVNSAIQVKIEKIQDYRAPVITLSYSF